MHVLDKCLECFLCHCFFLALAHSADSGVAFEVKPVIYYSESNRLIFKKNICCFQVVREIHRFQRTARSRLRRPYRSCRQYEHMEFEMTAVT